MTNHLIVGLGGTGGKVLRSFRKAVYQHTQAANPIGLPVDYLYVDSNPEFMRPDDDDWKVLGQSVQLDEKSQLEIRGIGLAPTLDSLANLPGINPWLGRREDFRDLLNVTDAGNIFGGQIRRLGRFLFACKAAQFSKQLRELVAGLEAGGTTGATFHVCCGLAGGTGSGIVVDVLSQIRATYPDSQYKIIVYALLPDKYPSPIKCKPDGNYHANGYAALMELNALSIGAFLPHDVTGNKLGRLTLSDPFSCCYLFTNENEDNQRFDVDKELPEILSLFLYQKIVATRGMTWTSLDFFEKFENGATAVRPEKSPSDVDERSRRFLSFGIKQVAYPEDEIRDYLAYSFAMQAALQLQHNNWSELDGYLDEPVNQMFGTFVEQKEVQERWLITEEHLSLSAGVLDSEINNPQWKTISRFWSDILPNFENLVRDKYADDETSWLAKLKELCEIAYTENYRVVGVPRYYQMVWANPKDHIRAILVRVEGDLFNEWKIGVKSMQDIARVLTALSNSLRERLGKINSILAQTRQNEVQYQSKVDQNSKEWSKLGVAGRWMGRGKSLFMAQTSCLKDLYVCRTRIEALQFAAKFVPMLTAAVVDLASDVKLSASMIGEATKTFVDSISERCVDGGQADLSKYLVRFYRPETVKSFTRSLIQNRELQEQQTRIVRTALSKLLGSTQGFAAFNEKISKAIFTNELLSTCKVSAITAHNDFLNANPDRERILGINVIDRLYKEYSGNPNALKSYMRDIVSRAKNFVVFNSLEQQLQGPGSGTLGTCQSMFTMILPLAPERAEFREAVIDAFKRVKSGTDEVVPSPHEKHEMTLVNITNIFPVRFLADVAFLKEKYDHFTAGTGEAATRKKMELHIEGDGSNFPPLFIRRATPAAMFPYLLIAQAMKVIRELEDPDTGRTGIYLSTNNDKGRQVPPVLLGSTIIEAVENADSVRLDLIETTVRRLLDGEYLHIKKREELITSIDEQVNAVLEHVNNKNPMDKTYRRFFDASQTAEAILTQRR